MVNEGLPGTMSLGQTLRWSRDDISRDLNDCYFTRDGAAVGTPSSSSTQEDKSTILLDEKCQNVLSGNELSLKQDKHS